MTKLILTIQKLKLMTQKLGKTPKKKLSKTPKNISNRLIVSEYDKAYREYLNAQINSDEAQDNLSIHSSATSTYGSEIIWFSVIIGLVFDFLLWKDIFSGKFGQDAWAERAERASAVILSFSYALICAQLGSSYAIKVFAKKRSDSTNAKKLKFIKNLHLKILQVLMYFYFLFLRFYQLRLGLPKTHQ